MLGASLPVLRESCEWLCLGHLDALQNALNTQHQDIQWDVRTTEATSASDTC